MWHLSSNFGHLNLLVPLGPTQVCDGIAISSLLHKHFSSWLSTYCNSVSIITNCTYGNMSKPNITAMSKIRTCSSQLVGSSLFSVMNVVRRFCTWIATSDVGLCVLLILVRKANDVEERTTSATSLLSPHLWLTVWQWHDFLLASYTGATTDCLSQIQKLFLKVEKWCKFSGRVTVKSHKTRASSIEKVTNTCKKEFRSLEILPDYLAPLWSHGCWIKKILLYHTVQCHILDDLPQCICLSLWVFILWCKNELYYCRSLDSPSNSLETVTAARTQEVGTVTLTANNSTAEWDSDLEAEPDPPDWSRGVDEEVLKNLCAREKKRQEVINGMFNWM